MSTPTLSTLTRSLVAEGAIFDAHADSLQRSLDIGHDLGVRGRGHMDLVRGREGGLGSQIFVCWVDPSWMDVETGGAAARADRLLGEFHRLIQTHPDQVAWCGNGEMLTAARAQGLIAGIPGIEGGHAIEGSLEQLEHFFDHGVRALTLVWNNHLPWIRSCMPTATAGIPEGLAPFGREVIRHMNALGMVVDLAHAGERSFFDALETSTAPVLASHTACMAVNRHPRNLSDDQLRALRDAGGVACMVFCTAFLDSAAQDAERAVRATTAYQELSADSDTALFLKQSEFLQRRIPPLPLERLVEHLMHAIEICGIDHVGIGSDFDGIQRTPKGLDDAACYPVLIEALIQRGLDADDLRKVLGANVERVYAKATGPGTRAANAALVPFA